MLATGNNSLNYTLSIRTTADGLSLYIYNKDNRILQKEVIQEKNGTDLNEALQKTLTRPRFTDLHFGQVQLVADTETTMLPLDEFRTGDTQTVYRLVFPQATFSAQEIHHEILPAHEAVLLFGLDRKTEQTVRRIYPNVQIRSLQGVLIEESAAKAHQSGDNGNTLFVHIEEKHMFVCLFSKNKLCFANSYDATNDDDRLYFMLAAWKALGLDTKKDCCTLLGSSSTLKEKAATYIRNVCA